MHIKAEAIPRNDELNSTRHFLICFFSIARQHSGRRMFDLPIVVNPTHYEYVCIGSNLIPLFQ